MVDFLITASVLIKGEINCLLLTVELAFPIIKA